MIGEIYSDRILKAAASIPPARRLDKPDATARRVSRVCGSEVEVGLRMEAGRVADFALEARACVLGQASSAIVARNIIGAEAEDLFKLRDQMRSMLKAGAPPPSGARWSELAALEPVREHPQRHASTLLVFDAICDCLAALGFSAQDQTAP